MSQNCIEESQKQFESKQIQKNNIQDRILRMKLLVLITPN